MKSRGGLDMTTGALSLIQTAVNAGVEVCFANPGTTEMPIVAVLDQVPGLRVVLGLFEGFARARRLGSGAWVGRRVR